MRPLISLTTYVSLYCYLYCSFLFEWQVWYVLHKDTDPALNVRFLSAAWRRDTVSAGETTACFLWLAALFLLPVVAVPLTKFREWWAITDTAALTMVREWWTRSASANGAPAHQTDRGPRPLCSGLAAISCHNGPRPLCSGLAAISCHSSTVQPSESADPDRDSAEVCRGHRT